MAERGSYVLFYENGITYRAVFALGKSGFGTGRRFCGIYNRSVSLCGDFCLLNYCTAYRAFDMLIALVYTVGFFVNNPI